MARKSVGKKGGRRSGNRGKPRETGMRKMSRHLEGVKDIDPDDYEFLRKFLTDQGKIIPGRLTGATAKQQRQIRQAVRRARVMGLVP